MFAPGAENPLMNARLAPPPVFGSLKWTMYGDNNATSPGSIFFFSQSSAPPGAAAACTHQERNLLVLVQPCVNRLPQLRVVQAQVALFAGARKDE